MNDFGWWSVTCVIFCVGKKLAKIIIIIRIKSIIQFIVYLD